MPEINLTKTQLDKLKNELIQIAKSSLKQFVDALKEDGVEMITKARVFTEQAEDLTIAMLSGQVDKDQYLDSLDDLKLAMSSFMSTTAYKKRRKLLASLVNILKKVASVAFSVLLTVV